MKNRLARAVKRRTRRFIYLLMIILMPGLCIAADHLVISEVLYDPLVTETGGEAVELHNPTGAEIDISGYLIATESSAADATVPAGTAIPAGGYYLIADTGWSVSRDDAGWPDADHEEAITMSNTDSGVAVTLPDGTIIDAVGWGNAAGITAGLYEGTPAAPVTAGNSLARTDPSADTDENSADLAEAVPDPQNSASTSGGGEAPDPGTGESLNVSVSVSNSAPSVDSVMLSADDDSTTSGVQVMPVPEGTVDVSVSAEVSDSDGAGTISGVSALVSGPGGTKSITLFPTGSAGNTTAIYNGTFQMQFHEEAGEYTITVTADDSAATGSAQAQFEYMSMAAISIDTQALMFTGAMLGSTAQIDGDYALSTAEAPTIRNTGNTLLDVGLYGTDLTDGNKSIGIGNIRYSFDNDFGSELSGALTQQMSVQALGLENSEDSVLALGFQLYVPPNTQNGNYTGRITVVAVSG